MASTVVLLEGEQCCAGVAEQLSSGEMVNSSKKREARQKSSELHSSNRVFQHALKRNHI